MLDTTTSFILVSLIFILLYVLSIYYTKKYDKNNEKFSITRNYMGLIYLTFGILKLYDINKFASIFSKYDIIAKNVPSYGYLYPFVEILLGLALLNNIHFTNSMKITILLMITSIISVIWSMINGQKLRCGCLGSFFHIPLSYVTLSENIVMLFMAGRFLSK